MRLCRVAAFLCLLTCPAFAGPDLPPTLKASGTLRMGVGNRIPPLGFHDPATDRLVGFEVDLGEALAARIGVRIEWQELVGFQAMLLAVQTDRIDAAIGAIVDLESRRTAVSFVDYLRTGTQLFVEGARSGEFREATALCGHKVGASSNTYFPAEIAGWSAAHCGDAPVIVVGTDGTGDARSQLKQGRIDAAVQGSETLPYIMAMEPGAYALVGSPVGERYNGIAVAKDDVALQTALLAALGALVDDGTYRALLGRWHLEANGVETPTINAGR